MVRCRCDCGNTVSLKWTGFICGRYTSCGCIRLPRAAERDLTGNRYGLLTVLSKTDHVRSSNGYTIVAYLCRCDCGKEKTVIESHLINGHARSCGCLVGHSFKNMRFGKLKVLSLAAHMGSMRYWKCKCDCGNETVVSQDDLFWGSAISCGCDRDNDPALRLEGRIFGTLTVIREVDPIFAPEDTLESVWLCRCECGREIVVPRDKLLDGKVVNCGCEEKHRRTAGQS